MVERFYLWIASVISLAFWILVGFLIIFTNPDKIDLKIFIIFFGSLFMSIFLTSFLIIFTIRLKFNKKELSVKSIIYSTLRQATLLSLAGVGLLLLQATRVLNWWDGALLVSAILLLELYFRAK